MHPKLVDVFNNLQSRRVICEGQDDPGNELVFPGITGKTKNTIRFGFDGACQRAKLFGVILRHTFASCLALEGHGELTIEKLGSWKDSKMVRRYAHLTQTHLDDAIDNLGMKNSPPVFTTSGKARSAGGS